jgi:hypothetical protein
MAFHFSWTKLGAIPTSLICLQTLQVLLVSGPYLEPRMVLWQMAGVTGDSPPPQEIRPPGESESGPGFEVCLHNQSREPINFYHILTWAQICLLHVLYLRV